MEYKIALDPRLDISPETFIREWNSDEALKNTATASIEKESRSFGLPPEVIGGLIGLGGFAAGIAKDVVKDLVKDFLKKKFGQVTGSKQPEIQEVKQPGETTVVLVILDNTGN